MSVVSDSEQRRIDLAHLIAQLIDQQMDLDDPLGRAVSESERRFFRAGAQAGVLLTCVLHAFFSDAVAAAAAIIVRDIAAEDYNALLLEQSAADILALARKTGTEAAS